MNPDWPTVSIITPTKDRLAYLGLLLRCIQAQDYPSRLLEWVVVDDGVAEAGLCRAFPGARHVRLDPSEGPCPLGRKRNLGHRAATGQILVCMDDDDYQPPHRVSRAVQALLAAPWAMAAGSSQYPLCFAEGIWMLGPCGLFHATAGTLAFRRELLEVSSCPDGARCAEEAAFLHDFTIPMVQIPPGDTILAMAHTGNTYDKRPILKEPATYRAKPTGLRMEDFIPDPELCAGYRQMLHGPDSG
jgi:glycosyltransferase involved in cell wall biosynthesis